MSLKRRVICFINYIKFSYFLVRKRVFGSKSPSVVLEIAKEFLMLQAPLYPNSTFLGRSFPKSAELLKSLVLSYLETKSEITLEQIMEVLKEEFIKRSEHGRK